MGAGSVFDKGCRIIREVVIRNDNHITALNYYTSFTSSFRKILISPKFFNTSILSKRIIACSFAGSSFSVPVNKKEIPFSCNFSPLEQTFLTCLGPFGYSNFAFNYDFYNCFLSIKLLNGNTLPKTAFYCVFHLNSTSKKEKS